ncbi:MAG: hypothetical protein RIQ60_4332 [Pseudomonadota bacterium]|jgi:hypothetical protein
MNRQIGKRAAWSVICLTMMCESLAAWALDCPDPPKQSQRDWDNEIKAGVGRIGPIKGAELEARIKTTTQDLLAKLPGADKLYLEQMMFAAYCSALRDDPAMPEADKARQIFEYRRALMTALTR